MKGFVILFALWSATACKKDYTCNCTSSWTNKPYDETVKAKSEKAAEDICKEKNSPEVDGPYNCHLK